MIPQQISMKSVAVQILTDLVLQLTLVAVAPACPNAYAHTIGKQNTARV